MSVHRAAQEPQKPQRARTGAVCRVLVLAAATAAGWGGQVHAQQSANTVYIQAGLAEHDAYAGTVGVTWLWPTAGWRLGSGQLQGHWDAYLSNWSSRDAQHARHNVLVAGIGPSLRWRGNAGRSPWFVELGTGVNYSSAHYRNGERRFGTRFNFASHLGVGMNFGAQRQHELSLRVQHASNAGIRRPNPGENFVLLRYARTF